MEPDKRDIEDVARLLLGGLAPGPARRLTSRIDGEPLLRVMRNEMRGLIASLEADDSVAAPANVLERVGALLRERRLAALVVAALIYDSRSRPQAGFRGIGPRYHLTFSAEGQKIDLQVEPEGDRWLVRGQVGDTPPATTGVVHFMATDGFDLVADASIDTLGYFEARAPEGEYDVQVAMPECTIVLERVRLG